MKKKLLMLNKDVTRRGCDVPVLWQFVRFSLIELLVVVAIISILMSLLLPALKNAREEATRIACTNQLKQWGVVIIAYTQDHDDYICWGFSGTGYYRWYHYDYLGKFMGAKDVSSGYDCYAPLCPMPGTVKSFSGQWKSYGMVMPYRWSGPWREIYDNQSPWKYSQVKNHTYNFLILDSDDYYTRCANQESTGTIPPASGASGSIPVAEARHRNRFNAVHYDGHADSYPPAAAGTVENDDYVERMEFWH